MYIYPSNCFICGCKFNQADDYGTPWPATCFSSRGNWGSTIIDGSPYAIEIWICDVCITQRKDKVVGYEEAEMPNEVREDVMEWYNKETKSIFPSIEEFWGKTNE